MLAGKFSHTLIIQFLPGGRIRCYLSLLLTTILLESSSHFADALGDEERGSKEGVAELVKLHAQTVCGRAGGQMSPFCPMLPFRFLYIKSGSLESLTRVIMGVLYVRLKSRYFKVA